jgi:unsaturated rhamnogalacturonyl hydrolase
MGWYGMALVDVLDYMPENHPAHARMVAMLNRFASAIVAQQDAQGVWYQITDKPDAAGNYEESSASAMFVYTLAKGVRKGWLPASYKDNAKKGYAGISRQFVRHDASGRFQFTGTADATGLGGSPTYRDGSVAYYTGVKQVSNDARGLGALLLAANEMEMPLGPHRTVLLDSWFNSETRKDVTGATIPYHYKWEEMDNNGLSFFAHAFQSMNADTRTLYTAPTARNLAGAQIYIIMDPNFETTPDNPHYNPHPNLISATDAKAIADWVHSGGVLLLFANDKSNSEFEHLNGLAQRFGITFNRDLRNRVTGSNFAMGRLNFDAGNFTEHFSV